MCGICGVLNIGPAAAPVATSTLQAMADSVRHRGPDAEGYFISEDRQVGFGFRRLSIIDLEAGGQPMPNEDGTIWIVQNGEIYNHASHHQHLEALGHRFRSRCDTEIILHLYEEFGVECVHYLRGMFAFALWDSRTRKLLLARDRIGVKPLYFATASNALVFGSEIKALLQHPAVQARLNTHALSLYLTFATTPAGCTLFDGIHKLPPGYRLIVDAASGRQQLERYWEPVPDPTVRGARASPEQYVEQLEELLRESVRLRMMSDVPYGAFLSGGVDSSLNVALMSELADRPVRTFSVAIAGDATSDELAFARSVAERYGTEHHEVVIGEHDFLDYLPKLVWQQDEPLADPVCIPLHAVSEAAGQSQTKVIQVGEGADELFSGYRSYAFFSEFHRRVWAPYLRLPAQVRRLASTTIGPWLRRDFAEYLARGSEHGELFWGGAIPFSDLHKAALLAGIDAPVGKQAVAALYAEVDRAVPDATQLDRMIGIELRQRLPELLLMRVDKVTMGSSLEARVPYLDHKLVEFALAIPSELKYRHGITKWVLKRVAERVGLPRDLVYRSKRGFCGSAANMLTPHLLRRAEEEIFASDLMREHFEETYVRSLFAEQRGPHPKHGFRLWTLWNLVAWHAFWFENARPQPAADLPIALVSHSSS